MTVSDFKQTYFSLHPKLYRIAFTILKNVEDAEDIIQETYCKLWNSRENLSDIQNPEAYCVTLVKHSCMDLLRSPRVSMNNDSIDDFDFFDNSSSIEKDLENKETIIKIKSIIRSLPKNQQKILRLRGFAGCSFEEIESITGESAVNIRVLLSRARSTIRAKLKL